MKIKKRGWCKGCEYWKGYKKECPYKCCFFHHNYLKKGPTNKQ